MNQVFSFWNMVQADAKIFFGFVVSGIVIMTLFRYFGLPQSVITTVMVSVVVFYTIIVLAYARLFLRLDQAGDNAYYLGLIFTLLSMMFALFTVSERVFFATDRQVESVIGDFGLALATTLAGIVCRLFLHQMRLDPADIERQTRLDLAGAAESMRQQIKGLSLQLNDFVDELSQRNNDFMSELTAKQIKAVERILAENESATSAIRKQANQLSGDWSQVQPLFLNSLADLSERMGTLSTSLERIGTISLESVSGLSKLEEPVEKGVFALNKFGVVATELDNQFKNIANHMATIAEYSASFTAESSARKNDIEKSISVLDDRIGEIIPSLEKSIESLGKTTERLAQSAERATETVYATEEGALKVLNGLAEALRKAQK